MFYKNWRHPSPIYCEDDNYITQNMVLPWRRRRRSGPNIINHLVTQEDLIKQTEENNEIISRLPMAWLQYIHINYNHKCSVFGHSIKMLLTDIIVQISFVLLSNALTVYDWYFVEFRANTWKMIVNWPKSMIIIDSVHACCAIIFTMLYLWPLKFQQSHNCALYCTWWRHQMEPFPRCRPFVQGIHRSPVNSPYTKASDAELWCSSLICAWINAWVNNRKAADLRRHRAHYGVIVMSWYQPMFQKAHQCYRRCIIFSMTWILNLSLLGI